MDYVQTKTLHVPAAIFSPPSPRISGALTDKSPKNLVDLANRIKNFNVP
jgi:hypothetical protein